MHPFEAIWDTGATNSVISQNVVDACGLVPIGMTQVQGVNSTDTVPKYLVNIRAPSGVGFASVDVTWGKLAGDIDVLIGMDMGIM